MKKPPEYMKVWLYLLAKANHQDNGRLQRGQGFVSTTELIDVLSYNVGYRIERPAKKKVWGIIDWLRNPYEGNDEGDTNDPMIETTRVTHGMVYTVCKYDLYQYSGNYKGNSESNNEDDAKETRREEKGNNNNKNDKQCNKEEEEYMPESGKKKSCLFDAFWKAYPKKTSKQEALKEWNKLKVDEKLLAQILDSLEKQKASVEWKKERGQFIPYPPKWIKGKRWEDEIQPSLMEFMPQIGSQKKNEPMKPQEVEYVSDE